MREWASRLGFVILADEAISDPNTLIRAMSDIPKFLSIEESHAVYRPVGEYSFDATVEMIDGAIAYCRENALPDLLVDITRITG